MKKKPPGEKNVSVGVSLPPDLYEWVIARVKAPSPDPTLSRSASKIVKQALMEYRERVEREESGGPDDLGKSERTTRSQRERKKGSAGAKTINPSESSATLSSMDGKARYRKAG